jgi:hypothetical protein
MSRSIVTRASSARRRLISICSAVTPLMPLTSFNAPVRCSLIRLARVITERPPERSVQARLRIRLLRRMSGVEASIGVGMQDSGRWYPSVEDWRIFRPLLSRGLTATNQNAPPQSMKAMHEGGQLVDVAGNSMVLVVTRYDLPQPCTDFEHAIMHPALKLTLDSFKLRSHPLLRSGPPYCEGCGLEKQLLLQKQPHRIRGVDRVHSI